MKGTKKAKISILYISTTIYSNILYLLEKLLSSISVEVCQHPELDQAKLHTMAEKPLFLQINFLPLSLSSSVTLTMQIIIHLMLFHKLIKLDFKIFLFFADLIGWVPLPYLQVHWSFPLHQVVCYWNPLLYFSVQLLYFFSFVISIWYFLYVPSHCYNSFLFLHSSPHLDEHIYDHVLEVFTR